jgi:site-specific DNA-methyltransferase (cytosine-N4-specific)
MRRSSGVTAVGRSKRRRPRTVWDINTQPYPEARFATFPPSLVRPCVRLTSKPGDLVLDPFIGSGTTALVAAKEGRRFLGIELNPEYLEIVRRRLEKAGSRERSR